MARKKKPHCSSFVTLYTLYIKTGNIKTFDMLHTDVVWYMCRFMRLEDVARLGASSRALRAQTTSMPRLRVAIVQCVADEARVDALLASPYARHLADAVHTLSVSSSASPAATYTADRVERLCRVVPTMHTLSLQVRDPKALAPLCTVATLTDLRVRVAPCDDQVSEFQVRLFLLHIGRIRTLRALHVRIVNDAAEEEAYVHLLTDFTLPASLGALHATLETFQFENEYKPSALGLHGLPSTHAWLASMPRLTRLDFEFSTANELAILASGANAARLTELNLDGVHVSVDGLAHLARFSGLTQCRLQHFPHDADLSPLAESMPHLRRLRLGQEIRGADWHTDPESCLGASLARFHALEVLELCGIRVTMDSVRDAVRAMPRLHTLRLESLQLVHSLEFVCDARATLRHLAVRACARLEASAHESVLKLAHLASLDVDGWLALTPSEWRERMPALTTLVYDGVTMK
jgi:hypothetical protein